jgi:hypothetical protein
LFEQRLCTKRRYGETTLTEPENVYAVFIDMMGFASAIEGLNEDEQRAVVYFMSESQDVIRFSTTALNPRSAQVHSGYKAFHRAVNELLKPGRYSIDTPNTLIVFSDSVYFITHDAGAAVLAARQMMARCFSSHIPLRVGIGYGSFVRLAFSTTAGAGGGLWVEAPFLGTAIVRAYRAQESAKGFRIFVHPSAAQSGDDAWEYVGLDETERTTNRVQELNFLVGERYRLEQRQTVTLEGWLRALNEMRRRARGDEVPLHYQATEAAIRKLFVSGESHSWGAASP